MKPSLTLQLVEMGPIDFPSRNTIPKQFSDHMDWYEGEDNEISSRSGTSVSGEKYYPILYGSEFWTTYSSLKEVNGTLKESKVDVTFEPVSVSFMLFCATFFYSVFFYWRLSSVLMAAFVFHLTTFVLEI